LLWRGGFRPRRGEAEAAICRATSDFRGLYSGLLEQWLGTDAEAIIPGARSFARPKILR